MSCSDALGSIHFKSNRSRAFTLIELLVVISIISMLMALLLPALNKARQTTDTVRCLTHLRQIGIASQSYVQDHQGRFAVYYAYQPPNYSSWTAWTQQISHYTNVQPVTIGRPGMTEPARSQNPMNLYRCPSIQRHRGTFFDRQDPVRLTDYAWNSSLGVINSSGVGTHQTEQRVLRPSQTVLVYDAPLNANLLQLMAGQNALNAMYNASPMYGYWHMNPTLKTNAGSHNVAFIDGHAKTFAPGVVRTGWFKLGDAWSATSD